jgi:hypothetical protein
MVPGFGESCSVQVKGHADAAGRSLPGDIDFHRSSITGNEAEMAGPWLVEPLPSRGFGLFRAGESPERGFQPFAVFPDRFLALLAAAILPGLGRDPLLQLNPEPSPQGYEIQLDDGTVVAHLELFDELFVGHMNAVVGLARSPVSLAYVAEAVGATALKRCGAILAERVRTAGAAHNRS